MDKISQTVVRFVCRLRQQNRTKGHRFFHIVRTTIYPGDPNFPIGLLFHSPYSSCKATPIGYNVVFHTCYYTLSGLY